MLQAADLLARHSTARHINILAYSAGAMVLSPGLRQLRNLDGKESPETLRQKLRLGEIYSRPRRGLQGVFSTTSRSTRR